MSKEDKKARERGESDKTESKRNGREESKINKRAVEMRKQ